MKHQYKPKKCKFIEHRAVKFDRETGNPKLDASGAEIPFTENRTAVCKINPKSIDPRLLETFDDSKETINDILANMSEHWFDVYTVESGVKNDMKKFTIMDLYAGAVPGDILKGEFTLVHGRKRVLVKKSITGYVTRELMAPQEDDGFILCDREQFINSLNRKTDKIFGEETSIPAKWWCDTICGDLDTMLKGYAQCVLGMSDTDDGKWRTAVHEVSESIYDNEFSRKHAERTIIKLGPQHLRHVNGLMPDTSVIQWPISCKICGENATITEPDFAKEPKLKRLYLASMKAFERIVKESFPKKNVFKPNIPMLPRDSVKKLDGYYNYSAELIYIPGPKKASRFRVEFRAKSDRTGNDYYPKDLFKFTSECVIPRFSMLKSTGAMTLNIPYTVPCQKPFMSQDAEINWDAGLGIDLGYARFAMVLSKPASKYPGMVNWHEAIDWFSKKYGLDVLNAHCSKATQKEIEDMIAEERDGKATMGAIFLLGVRDGNPPDIQHDWRPSNDPMATLFTRMERRTNKDGSPFYSGQQLAIIGHTKTFRIQMRQIFANRIEYYHRQSEWDLNHSEEQVFARESEVAKALAARYDFLNESIRCITQRFISDILTSDGAFRPAFIAMEDLNLNELGKDKSFKSLYMTITEDWGLDPRQDYKVSVRKGRTVAEITYPEGKKPPRPAQFPKVFPATEHWNTPERISAKGQTIVIACTPTSKGTVAMARDSIECYTKKALHIALIKHDVERLCTHMGILFREVSAKFTSQTCDCCGNAKTVAYDPAERGTDLYTAMAGALKEGKNFRFKRTFICGNPACPMCQVAVNADSNAASVICHMVRNGKSDYFKDKRAKFKAPKVKKETKKSSKSKKDK